MRPTVHSHTAIEPVARDFVQCTQKYPGCEQNKRPLVSPPPQKALVLISRSLSPEFPGLTTAGLQGIWARLTKTSAEPNKLSPHPLPLASPGCSDPASSPGLLSDAHLRLPDLPPLALHGFPPVPFGICLPLGGAEGGLCGQTDTSLREVSWG